MKNKSREKVKNISISILESLFDAMEGLATASLSKKDAYKILYQGNDSREWTDSSIGRWLECLKRAGYIQTDKSENNSIEFTNKGKIKILEKISKSKKHDNRYRFLSFDVPEDMRKYRNKFRRGIKKLGFIQIQQSLWVINKDVGNLVELLAYECKVEKYIAYIISDKSDIDGIINKRLKK